MMSNKKIGEIIIELGFITQALSLQRFRVLLNILSKKLKKKPRPLRPKKALPVT